ncbi:MAG TPA: DinB family protein [Gemmatimonadales bacterium]
MKNIRRYPRASRVLGMVGALAASGGSVAWSQAAGGEFQNAAQAQLADLEQMRDKFLALADAFPEETYAWRPMEGVRSVHDVMALFVLECHLFPTMWGFDKAPAAGDGLQAERARLEPLSKLEMIAEMRSAAAHLMGIVSGLSAEDRARQVPFFGRTVDLATAIGLMANDLHEHLGQSIAYARTNKIVPPWSRPQGQ